MELARQSTAAVLDAYANLPGSSPDAAAIAAKYIERAKVLDRDAKIRNSPSKDSTTNAETLKTLVKAGRLGAPPLYLRSPLLATTARR